MSTPCSNTNTVFLGSGSPYEAECKGSSHAGLHVCACTMFEKELHDIDLPPVGCAMQWQVNDGARRELAYPRSPDLVTVVSNLYDGILTSSLPPLSFFAGIFEDFSVSALDTSNITDAVGHDAGAELLEPREDVTPALEPDEAKPIPTLDSRPRLKMPSQTSFRKWWWCPTILLGADGLRNHFSEFGEVDVSTIVRDADGRSRSFAFLTFEDPASVNAVMIPEHLLDGKAIDPKRAIPR
ncbi:hypothetical protein EDB86DRAFT_3072736 [Lactarius hatsudake]|nr:hypothetical protein EDB86DRAFT_3072736 [Lactarius hatsudake]